VKDRAAITAMLDEVIGTKAAEAHLAETGTKKKATLRKALTGNGRATVEGWMPAYVRFPQAQYTERPLTREARVVA
jgi:ParB family transcriptional regulator, chromosome partitioning protein